MFMLLLRLKRYFCNHNYDFDGAVLNNNTGRWDIADCPKCGKAFRHSIPEFTNPPLPLIPLLDEVGFVFTDDRDVPYLVRLWGGIPWVFYRNNNSWVSLREVTQTDIFKFAEKRLSAEAAAIYS